MDLSSPTLEDLALAGDSVHVPDDVFSVLVKKLFDGINDGNERNISFLSGGSIFYFIFDKIDYV